VVVQAAAVQAAAVQAAEVINGTYKIS
jgi:hypothetical protein